MNLGQLTSLTQQEAGSKKRNPVVLLYVREVSEQLRRLLKTYSIPAYFKPKNTGSSWSVPRTKLTSRRW